MKTNRYQEWGKLFRLHPLLWEVCVDPGSYLRQEGDAQDNELALTLVDANGHPFDGREMAPAILSQFVDCICKAVNQYAKLSRCPEYPRPWVPIWNPTYYPTYKFAIPKAANSELINYRYPWGMRQNESIWMICDCVNQLVREV